MLSGVLKLKTKQIDRNRLWQHSIDIGKSVSGKETICLLDALVRGLCNRKGVLLHPYIVLPENTVGRDYFRMILDSGCPRLSLAGSLETMRNGGWGHGPTAYQVTTSKQLERYVLTYWGNERLSIFFSHQEPAGFFNTLRSLPILACEGGSLLWAPYWYPRSFERHLKVADAEMTGVIFRRVGYYLAEGEDGKSVRIYCRFF